MSRWLRYVWYVGCLIVLITPTAQGQNTNQLFVGARPMSLGETFVGIADDANTLYWNPAGLPLLQRQEFSFMYSDLYGIGLRNLYGAYVTMHYTHTEVWGVAIYSRSVCFFTNVYL